MTTSAKRRERTYRRRALASYMLSLIASRSKSGWNRPMYSRLEGRHGSSGANNLRAMVLGGNDGLVSLCVVMGRGRHGGSPGTLLATAGSGDAGRCLFDGHGQWISVQSARELQENRSPAKPRNWPKRRPRNGRKLTLIYQANGLHA